MNASWSMVLGALLAGLVGGFMIPVRPEIRDVPALTASKATEPAKTVAADNAPAPVAAKADSPADVRKVPLTQAASAGTGPAAARTQPDGNCATEAWPYRSPNCLDRTANVAPAETVEARPVEPTANWRDGTSGTAAAAAAKPEPAKSEPAKTETAKTEPAKPEPKVVSAPAREEQAEPAAPAGQPAAGSGDEPRAQAANERPEAKPAKQPRRAHRRTNRNTVDLNDGIPTRIYLRGPDGRLYLAPEYQPSGRTVYFVR